MCVLGVSLMCLPQASWWQQTLLNSWPTLWPKQEWVKGSWATKARAESWMMLRQVSQSPGAVQLHPSLPRSMKPLLSPPISSPLLLCAPTLYSSHPPLCSSSLQWRTWWRRSRTLRVSQLLGWRGTQWGWKLLRPSRRLWRQRASLRWLFSDLQFCLFGETQCRDSLSNSLTADIWSTTLYQSRVSIFWVEVYIFLFCQADLEVKSNKKHTHFQYFFSCRLNSVDCCLLNLELLC